MQLTLSPICKLSPAIDQIPVCWYNIGIPASSGYVVYTRRLGNWIFAQAKMKLFMIDSTKQE